MTDSDPRAAALPAHPCLPSLGEHCGKCHRCTDPEAALLASEPAVSERSYTLWMVYSPSRNGIAFDSEDRDVAEKWMRTLARPDNDYVLRSQPVRSRSETWWGEPTIVPWHSPCAWVGSTDDRYEDLRCQRHGWHRRDEPVPAEFWRPAKQAGASEGGRDEHV